MNYEYNNIYEVRKAWLEALGGDSTGANSVYEVSLRILEWYQSHSGGTCEHPIDIIFDIAKNISGYTGDYPIVFDKASQKWYMLNNLNQYEEYGIMETVEALSATTSYPGKLVILSGATPHEYEYNNGWTDLGELDVKYAGEFDGNSWFDTGVIGKNNMTVEYDGVITGYVGATYGSRKGTSGAVFSHNQFTDSTGLTSDLGSKRNTAATNYKDKDLHYKGWLYTSGSTNNDVMWGIYCTLDGNVSFNQTGTTTGANYDASGNTKSIYIGGVNSNGTVAANKFKGIFKSFKIYENIDATGTGTLAHDYTFEEVDGVVKMYDEVTETYFPNKGTGSVTLVPDWTPVKEYEEKAKPISSYSAETYCDLYDIDSALAYIGLNGFVDSDIYVINDEKKWEETSYPTIEYDGLIFKAGEGGGAVALNNFRSNTPSIQISYDGEDWENWDYSEIDLGYGQEVALRGTSFVNGGAFVSTIQYSTFVFDGQIFAKGNLMSLYDNGACTATTAGKFAFYYTFAECSTLENDGLMLPATTLNTYSYDCTFKGCSNMVEAPDLPAKVVSMAGYEGMFSGCTKLEYIYMLANDKSANATLQNWVRGVAATGTFVKATDAWWTTTGANGVPNGWTIKYSGQTEASVSTIALTSGVVSSTFYVQTDTYEEYNWEITDYPAWCTLSTTAKTADRTAVVVTPQANNDEPRTGNIVITADDREITIPVYQEGYAFGWENLYSQYKGTDRYWYVQYGESATTISLTLGNNSKTWEIAACPEWCTLSATAGTGSTNIIVSATPNTETNYREGIITAQSGSRSAIFRVMQYKFPVVLSDNLKNKYHDYNSNEPITTNNCYGFDIAVGDIVPVAYDFVGMKSIIDRTDGSSWRTNPYVMINGAFGSGIFENVTKIEIDASTIIQMEQALNYDGGSKNFFPNCTDVTFTNCSGITKGFCINALKSASTISIGNLPAVSSAGISLPQTTTLTDLSIGSTYANKNLVLSGCTNLTVTSLLSVLNALPDNTGTSYSQTCTLGATNLAKLTAEQIAIGTNKGWIIT